MKITLNYSGELNMCNAATFIYWLGVKGAQFEAKQEGDLLVITLTGGF
jgi:hypothetical protein